MFILCLKLACCTCQYLENYKLIPPLYLFFIISFILATEIEHISAMFQEKQQELQAAVLKVDQLTQQLEDLRKGKLNGFQSYNGQVTGPAAVELKKLYQELQVSTTETLLK